MGDKLPNPAYPINDSRAWLDGDELPLWTALECPDLTMTYSVSVKLEEYQPDGTGRAKRAPSRGKYTPEQDARQKAASAMLNDYARAHSSGVVFALLQRLALERWERAGSPVPPSPVVPA
jgi:hypothetical protein